MNAAKAAKRRGTPNPERPYLQAAWLRQFGMPPPAFLSVLLMKSALEFERQCKGQGGHRASVRRQLEQIANGQACKCGKHRIRNNRRTSDPGLERANLSS